MLDSSCKLTRLLRINHSSQPTLYKQRVEEDIDQGIALGQISDTAFTV
jgi:hypothetical protein